MNQNRIDKMLKWGIIFSVIWLAGLGSLASFIIGVKAKTKIKASTGTLTGIGRAWWVHRCRSSGGRALVTDDSYWDP